MKPVHLDQARLVLAVLADGTAHVVKSRVVPPGRVTSAVAMEALAQELATVETLEHWLLVNDLEDDDGVIVRRYACFGDDYSPPSLSDDRALAASFDTRDDAVRWAGATRVKREISCELKPVRVRTTRKLKPRKPIMNRVAFKKDQMVIEVDNNDPDTMCGILGLALAIPPQPADLACRSKEELELALEWACLEHLGASDNPVDRKPLPAWLRPWDRASTKHAHCKHEPNLAAAAMCELSACEGVAADSDGAPSYVPNEPRHDARLDVLSPGETTGSMGGSVDETGLAK